MKNPDKHDPVYSIGTVARLLGVSVQTLRLYERRGLILANKSKGNQRLYSSGDIDRLRCIRTAITGEKIGIEGIRRIHSMIPCWEHIQCSLDQRLACPAYTRHEAGCWTFKHASNVCSERECRVCEIYTQSSDCGWIKSFVRLMRVPAPHPTIPREEMMEQNLV